MGPFTTPPRGGGSAASDATQLVWAHNPAAAVGAAFCAVLLFLWLHEHLKDPEEDDGEV